MPVQLILPERQRTEQPRTRAEAAVTEPQIWTDCGFTKMLSPTRLNGLMNVRKRIREIAEGWNCA